MLKRKTHTHFWRWNDIISQINHNESVLALSTYYCSITKSDCVCSNLVGYMNDWHKAHFLTNMRMMYILLYKQHSAHRILYMLHENAHTHTHCTYTSHTRTHYIHTTLYTTHFTSLHTHTHYTTHIHTRIYAHTHTLH